MIVDAFEADGVPVDEIVACGGLPERNQLLMQIYADVTGREFAVAASKQTPALGSAMFGAVAAGAAAGGYDSIVDASRRMAHLERRDLHARRRPPRGLRRALREYVRLHDLFGRGGRSCAPSGAAQHLDLSAASGPSSIAATLRSTFSGVRMPGITVETAGCHRQKRRATRRSRSIASRGRTRSPARAPDLALRSPPK